MNIVIKTLVNPNAIVFILQTEGENDFWWWEVERTEVETYNGTETEFVNDEDNATLGTSCGSFKTVEEAIDNYESDEF